MTTTQFPRSGAEAKQMGRVEEYADYVKQTLLSMGSSEDQAQAAHQQVIQKYGGT